MKDYITLPFYSFNDESVLYLNKAEVLNYAGLDNSSALFRQLLINEGISLKKRTAKKPSTDKTILVVEPHPDDFALSASGFVLDRISAGFSCTVLNIFSRTSLENFPWKDKIKLTEHELEELRLLESNLAVQDYLGQRFKSLRLPLASLRGNKNVFSDRHNEDTLVKVLTENLCTEINKSKPSIVLCPLGVQGHIDHLVVFDATLDAYKNAEDKFELILYQEYPYSRNKKAYNSRLDFLSKKIRMSAFYLPIDDYLETISDLIVIYKSQFDDINRQQMFALLREDFRAISAEASDNKDSSGLMQKYFKVEAVL